MDGKKQIDQKNIDRLSGVVGITKPATKAIVRLLQSDNPSIEKVVEKAIIGIKKESLLHKQPTALKRETLRVFIEGIAHSVGYVMSHDDRSVVIGTIERFEEGDLFTN